MYTNTVLTTVTYDPNVSTTAITNVTNITGGHTVYDTGTIVALTSMVLINVVALLANLSVIIVILKNASLRHTLTNLFVLNLCSVDFLSSLLVLPITTTVFAKGYWPWSTALCMVDGFLNALCAFASILSLCVISVERYYSIKLPMHHAANMTLCRTVCVLVCIWTFSCFFAM
jgi:hypothetical protein